jgi:hypothetical protein
VSHIATLDAQLDRAHRDSREVQEIADHAAHLLAGRADLGGQARRPRSSRGPDS